MILKGAICTRPQHGQQWCSSAHLSAQQSVYVTAEQHQWEWRSSPAAGMGVLLFPLLLLPPLLRKRKNSVAQQSVEATVRVVVIPRARPRSSEPLALPLAQQQQKLAVVGPLKQFCSSSVVAAQQQCSQEQQRSSPQQQMYLSSSPAAHSRKLIFNSKEPTNREEFERSFRSH